MKLKFHPSPFKRGGLFWSVKDENGQLHGAMSSSFSADNNGGAFSSNRGKGYSAVWVTLIRHDGTEVRLMQEKVREHRYRDQADKWARAWLRENDARAKLVAAIMAESE
jgi:hypothetical protein